MKGRIMSAAYHRSGLGAVLLLCLCCKSHAAPTSVPAQLISANYGFAFNLFQQIAAGEPGSNIFISPYSASTAFQMVGAGAAGTTREQMQEVLGTSGLRPEALYQASEDLDEVINAHNTNFVLTAANAVWYQKGFPIERSFLEDNETYFGATVKGLDFSDLTSADLINAWASNSTRGKIDKIVSPPLDPSLVVLLANAVYFHGNWQYKFDTNLTTNGPFYLPGGSPESVTMMQQTANFEYTSATNYQAVRLNYQGSNIAMYVFLPSPDSSLEELLAQMSGPWWQQTVAADFLEQSVSVALPKFNLNYQIELNAPMEALGMTDAFSLDADFLGISRAPVHISKATQQAIVEVDESGTVAAAVTTISVVTSVAGIQPITMTVNRPFLFFIEDRLAGTLLFMGAVVNP
jgi:serpin B